jgi:hypothetical protein
MPGPPTVNPHGPQEHAEWEREVLGLPVSVHPLQLVTQPSPHLVAHSDELSRHTGQNVTLVGVRLAVHRWMTSQHELTPGNPRGSCFW